MRYKAVVFDVSDTLIEYTPNYASIYGERVRRLGFEVSREEAKAMSSAVNWAIGEQSRKEQMGEPSLSADLYQRLLDEAALSCVVDKNLCTKDLLANLAPIPVPDQQLSIIPDAISVLTKLKCKYRLAIVSNHYAWMKDHLRDCGLAPYFESIIISDLVGVAKPNPRIMEISLRELNLKAEQCLYVGDHPYDVLCSKQAGMDCAWLVKEYNTLPESIPYREDHRISSLTDLLSIL